jgi:hypothetical protein
VQLTVLFPVLSLAAALVPFPAQRLAHLSLCSLALLRAAVRAHCPRNGCTELVCVCVCINGTFLVYLNVLQSWFHRRVVDRPVFRAAHCRVVRIVPRLLRQLVDWPVLRPAHCPVLRQALDQVWRPALLPAPARVRLQLLDPVPLPVPDLALAPVQAPVQAQLLVLDQAHLRVK